MNISKWILGTGFLTIVAITTAKAEMGVATIKGTAPDSQVSGVVTFTDSPEGLKISASVLHVPPGLHGFHIHEFGSCEDSGKAAGSHYNPMNSPHGMVMKDGSKKAHAGDMGNLEVGSDGFGKLEAVLKGVSLSGGKETVGGRAVILHEKIDDFSQPTGNAGARIGCGPIIITGK